MSEIREKRHILDNFRRSIGQSAFVLKENPELAFSQIYNRSQRKAKKIESIRSKLEEERDKFTKPWLKLISDPHESSNCVQTLSGHKADVYYCAFSPNGKMIISASRDKTVRIWEADTGMELSARDIREDETVLNVLINADLILVISTKVSGSSSNAVNIWDFRTGDTFAVLKGHSGSVNSCSSSSDGRRLATASDDRTLKIWDIESKCEIVTLQGHTDAVNACSFSKDGKFVVSAGEDNILKIWDSIRYAEINTLTGNTQPVMNCAFTPDGNHIVSLSGHVHSPHKPGHIKIWDTATGREVATLEGHNHYVNACAISPDSRLIVTAGQKILKLWDALAFKEIATLRGHGHGWPPQRINVFNCAFSPNGNTILSASADGTLKVWDPEPNDEMPGNAAVTERIYRCLLSQDDNLIITAEGKNVEVRDALTREKSIVLTGHSLPVGAIALSPDDECIYSGSRDGTLKKWNIKSGAVPVNLGQHSDWVNSCVCAPDGSLLVSASVDRTLRTWDVADGKEISVLRGHIKDVMDVAFSPDGKNIVSASRDGTLKMWSIESDQALDTIMRHDGAYTACEYSPDGKKIVTASTDNTLKIWDVKKGRLSLTLRGHEDCVNDCKFSPDCNMIASVSHDRTLRIWRSEDGADIALFKGHSGNIPSFAFSSRGNIIVLADMIGQILVLSCENIGFLYPIITAIRFKCCHDKFEWEDTLKSRCRYCRRIFPISEKTIDVIVSIMKNTGITPNESPVLHLPDEAWDEPGLISECPLCYQPLKFNPFIVDNRET
ncbi:MAG: WD40 repeat domain-containing protein [Deltaproteobacteria bacterium]|nr:WD40 repeat domain-containing protein [Deltaproteobacteria bacterium]